MIGSPRYIATRLNGDGTETIIDPDLPLTEFTEGLVLNNGSEHSAKIAPRFEYLYADDGQLVLDRWSTAIYSVDGGRCAGGILVDYKEGVEGDLELEIMGFAGYPNGMPYTDSWFGVQIDPIDAFRQGWDHLQSKPGGNLGLVLDETKAGYLVGQEIVQGEFDTEEGPLSFEFEPIRFAWYETDDLGAKLAELATNTPFDFTEIHTFDHDTQTFGHRLAIGFPMIGGFRHDLRFYIGENVAVPELGPPEGEYANQLLVLGAGEGSAMVRAEVHRPDGRIRRVLAFDAKDAQTSGSANLSGQAEILEHTGQNVIDSITILPGTGDEADSVVVGDLIRLQGRTDHRDIDWWLRVLKISRTHGGDGTVELDVKTVGTNDQVVGEI